MKNKFFAFLITAMSALSADAQQCVPNPFGNALIPDMIADASIQEFNGVFYCYATTDGYGRGLDTSGPPVVWKSDDFVNWHFEGTYFPSAENQKYWAPSKVVSANGKYYIYPTINGIMYPAVADSPDGPFRLARGEDKFEHPAVVESTLLGNFKGHAIDAEIFIDDDGQAYVFWGRRKVAKLAKDMINLEGDIQELVTPHKQYSEGPIFFKRKGIYYYLYTIGGDEKYQYAYMMSRVSPTGPYEFPENDIISTTNYDRGVFGPGHGCVFNLEGTDDWYFAFLEFSRRSTNRQTYVNRLEFNEDGTIRPVEVSLDGVGALRKVKTDKKLPVASVNASSTAAPLFIKPNQDPKCLRTEYFVPEFAIDGSNGSRWMPAAGDNEKWIIADLGKSRAVSKSEAYFVRPTAGHAYVLEGSADGKTWTRCGGYDNIRKLSPHTDNVDGKYRYLRIKIKEGEAGLWEWNIY